MASYFNIDELTDLMSECSFPLSNKLQKLCAFQGYTYKKDYPKGEVGSDFTKKIS